MSCNCCDSHFLNKLQKLIFDYPILAKKLEDLGIKVDTLNIEGVVDTKLQELINTGEINRMINEAVIEALDSESITQIQKTAKPTLARIWRRMNVTGVNDSFNASQVFAYGQGSCFFRQGNTNRFLHIQGKKDEATSGTAQKRISIFNTNNTEPIYSDLYPVGHGQDVTYNSDDEYFYIIHADEHEGVQSHNISRVKLNANGTLANALDDTISIDNHYPFQIDFYNHNLYVLCRDKRLYTLDWNTSKLTPVFPFELEGLSMPTNGMCVWKDKIFIANKETVATYSLLTGDYQWGYLMQDVSDDGYTRGEIESLSHIPNSNRIAVFTNTTVGVTSGIAQRCLSNIFVFDPIRNKVDTEYTLTDKYATNHATLYVYGNTQNQNQGTYPAMEVDLQGIVNPDGTQSKPFSTCQEALDYFANTNNGSVELRIFGASDRTFQYISGIDVRVIGTGDVSPVLGGIFVENGGTIRLRGRGTVGSTTFYLYVRQTATMQVAEFTTSVSASLNCVSGQVVLENYARVKASEERPSPEYKNTVYTLRVNEGIVIKTGSESLIDDTKSVTNSLTVGI